MHGLIGRFPAHPGRRDRLLGILTPGIAKAMPLINSFGEPIETVPAGGRGIPGRAA